MPVLDLSPTWTTPLDRSLLVDEGRVTCPRRGLVDVERCLECEYLLAVEGEWAARIVCAYPYSVSDRVVDELASGRRWSRTVIVETEVDVLEERPEELLPGDVRPDAEPTAEEDAWRDDLLSR
jgi:hypothetical protein